MKLHRAGEDYLETILILQRKKGAVRSLDVSEALGISKPSVSRAIRLLKDGGFLTMHEDKTLTLTQAGREVAEAVYEKHCVLKDGLVLLGVDPVIAEQDACKIEHVISCESFEKIKKIRLQQADFRDSGVKLA